MCVQVCDDYIMIQLYILVDCVCLNKIIFMHLYILVHLSWRLPSLDSRSTLVTTILQNTNFIRYTLVNFSAFWKQKGAGRPTHV